MRIPILLVLLAQFTLHQSLGLLWTNPHLDARLLDSMRLLPFLAVLVASVIGMCAALFEPAEGACLPNLIPAEQLSTAVAMNSASGHLGPLSGTAAGGFLFAHRRLVPFAVDVLTHTLAFLFLIFLRVPRTRGAVGTGRSPRLGDRGWPSRMWSHHPCCG